MRKRTMLYSVLASVKQRLGLGPHLCPGRGSVHGASTEERVQQALSTHGLSQQRTRRSLLLQSRSGAPPSRNREGNSCTDASCAPCGSARAFAANGKEGSRLAMMHHPQSLSSCVGLREDGARPQEPLARRTRSCAGGADGGSQRPAFGFGPERPSSVPGSVERVQQTRPALALAFSRSRGTLVTAPP